MKCYTQVYVMNSIEAAENAYNVLKEDGIVIEAIHELPWNKYCATVMDRYGVCWWIGI